MSRWPSSFAQTLSDKASWLERLGESAQESGDKNRETGNRRQETRRSDLVSRWPPSFAQTKSAGRALRPTTGSWKRETLNPKNQSGFVILVLTTQPDQGSQAQSQHGVGGGFGDGGVVQEDVSADN